MKTVILKFKHELKKMVPPTLFFFIILPIVVLIRALMIKGTGLDLPTSKPRWRKPNPLTPL